MSDLERALAELAIFPLPDVVLFPGAALPLHVFEPRYVEMTRDVVAGSGRIAIVRLVAGHEADYLGRPPVHPVATVGKVIASQEIPGDRFAIVVRGTDRIAIERELPATRSYRQVVARLLPDQDAPEDAMAAGRAELLALCEGVAARLGEGGVPLRELLHAGGGTAELTLALSAGLVRDPDQRQALLELRDPVARLDRLTGLVAELLSSLGPASSAPN